MLSETMRKPEISKDYSKHKTLTSHDIEVQTMAYLKLGHAVETVDFTSNAGYREPRKKMSRQQNINERRKQDWLNFQARKEAQ